MCTGISSWADAFCVYNFSDIDMKFLEIKGGSAFGRFDEDVEPGAHKCCNWKNKSCNNQGKRDSNLIFKVGSILNNGFGGTTLGKVYCDNVNIKAGGWLVIKGKNGHYYCEAGYNP